MASEAWGSYPSIFALGHKHLAELFSDDVNEIKEKLFKYAWPRIQRGITAGIPAWYKDEILLKAQFDAGSWGTQ